MATNKDKKKKPQQQPNDPDKHNAQQEREYRKQKNGTLEKPPKNPEDEEAIEKYEDINEEDVKDSQS